MFKHLNTKLSVLTDGWFKTGDVAPIPLLPGNYHLFGVNLFIIYKQRIVISTCWQITAFYA
jgi:hypothetical protein